MTVPLPPSNSPVWQDSSLCTYETCPLNPFGQLHYRPSLGANAFFAAIFGLGLLINIGLAIRYRTWGYLVAIIGGTGLEIVGYIGRIMLWNNDFDNNSFIIYLVGLTIGPAFFSAAIYLCLARIISVYGTGLSFFSPKIITLFFMACDLVSLILQAAGGAMASLATTSSQTQTGINIMIAGLSTQVISMFAFVCVCSHLAWTIRKNPQLVNTDHEVLRRSKKFRFWLWAIGISTLAILIRCSFRVAELSDGFSGAIANNEAEFIVLDGVMMTATIILLTTAHPGWVLGNMWKAGGFRLRKEMIITEKGQISPPERVGSWGPGAETQQAK